METIIQFPQNHKVDARWIRDIFRTNHIVTTERAHIGHPTPHARIRLIHGDAFMVIVHDAKAKRLHVKIYDPSPCKHLPFQGQVLDRDDLVEMEYAIRDITHTVHTANGALSAFVKQGKRSLVEETHVYADLTP